MVIKILVVGTLFVFAGMGLTIHPEASRITQGVQLPPINLENEIQMIFMVCVIASLINMGYIFYNLPRIMRISSETD